MKKNKKGFTLIELLAVIVILAIIALIAVPIVLNLIEKARKGAFERSAAGVLKASKLYYTSSLLETDGAKEITFDCKDNKCISDKKDINGNLIELDVDGNVGKGYVTITEAGEIEMLLTNETYCVSKSKVGELVTQKGNCSNVDLKNDTTSPEITSINIITTTNSITVTVDAKEDISRIYGYQYSIDNTTWYPSEPQEGNSNVYTFENLLKEAEPYTVYVRVYNELYGKDSYTEEKGMNEGKKENIELEVLDKPIISVEPKGEVWATLKTVTVEYPEGDYIKEYSLDKGTTWLSYIGPIEFTTEGTIVARVSDGNNSVQTDTESIIKIGEQPPILTLNIDEEVITKEVIGSTETTVDLSSYNLSNYNHISCNNGIKPVLNGTNLILTNIVSDISCIISNNLKTNIDSMDNTSNYILMINDTTLDEQIKINGNQNIILDLNGKTISLKNAILNYGEFSIIESENENGTIISLYSVINSQVNSTTSIENVSLISTNTASSSAICTNGYLEISGDTYVEGPYGIGCHNDDSAVTIINNAHIKSTLHNTVQINSGYNASITLNDGIFDGNRYAVMNWGNGTININDGVFSSIQTTIVNNSTGIINVNGGTFVSNEEYSIGNFNTGSININQNEKSIYITSLAQEWHPAVHNGSTGTISIIAQKANACTSSSSDTINGLCIYAEGNKDFTSGTSNGGIRNYDDGTIYLNGGTIYGGYQGINNNGAGIINVINSEIVSGRAPIFNNNSGTINICNSTINSLGEKDLYAYKGVINYSSNVIFTNGDNIPQTYIDNDGQINGNYTGNCLAR